MKFLSEHEHFVGFTGFGLYSRRVVTILREIGEVNPYFRTLIPELGFRRAFVEYQQPKRNFGRSKNQIVQLVDYALLGFLSSSKITGRIISVTGAIISLLCILVSLGYLIAKLLFWDAFSVGGTASHWYVFSVRH